MIKALLKLILIVSSTLLAQDLELTPENLSSLHETYRNEIENPIVIYESMPFSLKNRDLSDETIDILAKHGNFANNSEWLLFIENDIVSPIDQFLLRNTVVIRREVSRFKWKNRIKRTTRGIALQTKIKIANDRWQGGITTDVDAGEKTPFDHIAVSFFKNNAYKNTDIIFGAIKLSQSTSYLMASAFGFPSNSPSALVRLSSYTLRPYLSTTETGYLNGIGFKHHYQDLELITVAGWLPTVGVIKDDVFVPDLDGNHTSKLPLQKCYEPFAFSALNFNKNQHRLSFITKVGLINNQLGGGVELKGKTKVGQSIVQSSFMMSQEGCYAGSIAMRLNMEPLDFGIRLNSGNGEKLTVVGKEGYDGTVATLAIKSALPLKITALALYIIRLDMKNINLDNSVVRNEMSIALFHKRKFNAVQFRYRQKNIDRLLFIESSTNIIMSSIQRHDIELSWRLSAKRKSFLLWKIKLATQKTDLSWALNMRFEHQIKYGRLSWDIWRFSTNGNVKLYGSAPEVGLPVRLLLLSGDGWREQVIARSTVTSGLFISTRIGMIKLYSPVPRMALDFVLSLALELGK